MRSQGPLILRSVSREGVGTFALVLRFLEGLLVRGCLTLLILGGLDYVLAWRRHRKELMMTRDELKKEHRESEGDPRHRAQRRALHRALALGGPARGVQRATAVVVNPTHIAVALRYAPDECEAPYLVAKAREGEAVVLRGEAQRRGIPVVRDVALARSLVNYDVGEEIPEELYRAAAVVLKLAARSLSQIPDGAAP
jgi:type III secretion protein U